MCDSFEGADAVTRLYSSHMTETGEVRGRMYGHWKIYHGILNYMQIYSYVCTYDSFQVV